MKRHFQQVSLGGKQAAHRGVCSRLCPFPARWWRPCPTASQSTSANSQAGPGWLPQAPQAAPCSSPWHQLWRRREKWKERNKEKKKKTNKHRKTDITRSYRQAQHLQPGSLAVFLSNQTDKGLLRQCWGSITFKNKEISHTTMKAWSPMCLSPLLSASPSRMWRLCWMDCRKFFKRPSFSSRPSRTLLSSFFTQHRAVCSSSSRASLMAAYCCSTLSRASHKTTWKDKSK